MMSARCYHQTSKWRSTNEDQFSDLTSEVTDLNDDQQNYAEYSGIRQRMRQMLDKGFHTDVVFYPRDNSGSSISAHRAILAFASPLFETMLYSEKSEVSSEDKMEIYISNMSFLAFSSIVRYLYTDEIFFENDAMAQEILNGAQQFEIQTLIDHCNSYFEKQELTMNNVFLKLNLSNSTKVDALKEKCLEYIQQNTYQIFSSPDFLDCSYDIIQRICKLQSLNLRSEVELIDGAVLWLNNQPPVQKMQSTQKLLKCFRFLTLTIEEMSNVLKKYSELISPADGLQILLYLTNPPKTANSTSLPKWCNKSTSVRCCFAENNWECKDFSRNTSNVTESIFLPLKLSYDSQYASDVTSLIKMKCFNGSHQIFGIKLSFQPPVNHKSSIGLIITVRVSPSGFKCQERIEIMNSLDVRVPFKKRILARKGDFVHIEVEAQNIVMYNFYEFDDSVSQPPDPHFRCTVRSIPENSRIFCISEIEYGEPKPKNRPYIRMHQH